MKTFLQYLFLVVLLMSATSSFSQKRCYSDEYLKEQIAADPTIAIKRIAIEASTTEFIQKGGSGNVAQRGTPLYTIPVVVHVVYNTSTQNITDAQIQSQLAVLNMDYQWLNTDSGLVPSAFKPFVTDCKIQFCLAKRDPSGNATSGIIRKQTATTAFTTNDQVKYNATGGDDAWDSRYYLNLWVCNLSGGVLGYAQFPGGPAATDGVVIQHSAFGTTGTAVAPYNLGRTTTHEIGHWLNLYHIWGDDGGTCTGSDYVQDTPNQGAENYGCPVFPRISCNNGPSGDMFMNFMDYVYDRCMMMFTHGQKDRMYALFQSGGARSTLVTSNNRCTAPTLTGCTTPSNLTAGNITQTGATISWTAVSGASTYTLQYKTSAATAYTSLSTKGTSATLSGLTASTTYNYRVAANCSVGSSAYTALQVFTTLAVVSNCSDIYESNNSTASAVAIPTKTNVFGLISTKSDVDFFKFSNSATESNINVYLTGLPADYDLKLYSPTGVLLKTSANRGTTSESIVFNTTVVGTYIVHVYGYNGSNNTTKCYTLNAQIGNTVIKIARLAGLAEEDKLPKMKLFPVPASKEVTLSLENYAEGTAEISIISSLGSAVARKRTSIFNGKNTTSLDVSHLSNGVYFIKVQQGEVSTMEKIIIQR